MPRTRKRVRGICISVVELGFLEQPVEPLLPVGQVAGLPALEVFEVLDDLLDLLGRDLTVLVLLEKAAQERGILRTEGLLGLGERPVHLLDALFRLATAAELVLHRGHVRPVQLHGLGHAHPAVQDGRDGPLVFRVHHACLHGIDVLPSQAHRELQPFRDALLALAELEHGLHRVLQVLLRRRQRASDVGQEGPRDHVGLAVDVDDLGLDFEDLVEIVPLDAMAAVDDDPLIRDQDRRELHPRIDQLGQTKRVVLVERLSNEQVRLQILQLHFHDLHAVSPCSLNFWLMFINMTG